MFQRHLLQLAAWHGLLSYHTHNSRRFQPGFPDCVLLGPAGVIYGELKTTKGPITPPATRVARPAHRRRPDRLPLAPHRLALDQPHPPRPRTPEETR